MSNQPLPTNAEKLAFVLKHLDIDINDVIAKFGMSKSYISKLQKHNYEEFKDMHKYAFESAYGIPRVIFEDESINSEQKIIATLKTYQNVHMHNFDVFSDSNSELLERLVGQWYGYFHHSNAFKPPHQIKTTIYDDYRVLDANGNSGRLCIGKHNQSMIIKESKNSKNLISMTFDNHRVAYKLFPVSLVSKRNSVNREMLSFGFFSKKELDMDTVQTILGEVKNVQLKMHCDFDERIGEYIGINS
ncbi:MAG: hypothetical protein U9N49_10440 [Campylobacterota bacterium]|nr:hypothetical protein [Campylobacterota bacterium]